MSHDPLPSDPPTVWVVNYANDVEQRREICRHADKVFVEDGRSAACVDVDRVFASAALAIENARSRLFQAGLRIMKQIDDLAKGGAGG